MPSAKNKFSSHILNTEPEEEPTVITTTIPVSVATPRPVNTVHTQNSPLIAQTSQLNDLPRTRPDYRKTRASKEGKKYLNILIDEELQSELKPRMVTRKLTWETLVEGLLKRWLAENPGYKP